MKRKLAKFLFIAALPMAMNLSGCSKSKINIGICQLVNHEALDLATKGFVDAVKKGLGEENVNIDLQNAAGDSATCVTIANSFVSKNVDLIMANATPALQAAYNSTTTIPILGTSITEYGVALDIDNFDGVTNQNVSGTSDLAPLNDQADMILEVLPSVKNVGLLYCSAEANSLYQVDVVENRLKSKGINTQRLSFADSNDLSTVLNGKINSVDAIYVPTDNTCAASADTIDSICRAKKVPVVAGEESICKKCGIITLSISYYNIGVKTGEMAVRILKDKEDISKMRIEYDDAPVKKYNQAICQELGIDVPSDYIAIE